MGESPDKRGERTKTKRLNCKKKKKRGKKLINERKKKIKRGKKKKKKSSGQRNISVLSLNISITFFKSFRKI